MYWGGFPIVSLDKIYLRTRKDVLFLDCTRLDGSKKLVSRNNASSFMNVEEQVKKMSEFLKFQGTYEIVLADDVIFTGTVLRTLKDLFQQNGIQVIGIRGSISMEESYQSFNRDLPLGLKCGYVLESGVIDQICERDFYFGIAQSGISVVVQDGVYKSPYFKPFGNPVERASIPVEQELEFSRGCLRRSIALWEELERLSGKSFKVKELPEVIINTNREDSVVKVLKKGMRNL